MKNKYFCVINLGLRSIRVVLFNEKTEIIEKNWYPVSTTINKDMVEQNPNEWWSLCKRLLKEMFAKNPEYATSLQSISVTSSAACLVLLDKNGQTLMNSVLVSDKRASKQAQKLRKKKSFRKIFSNPNNLAVASFMFPKMLWIMEHNPSLYKKTAMFMSSNDFLFYRLSGLIVTDALNAEKFYFNHKDNAYPKELLRFLKISSKQLPKVLPIGSIIGEVLPEMQKELGIKKHTKLVLSSYDAICAFIGSGIAHEGDVNNVCGTVSSVRAYTKKNIKGRQGILSQTCSDFRIVGGSNNIDGGLLEWSKNMFYGDTYPEKYVYTIMAEEAEQSGAGAGGLLFLPYILGERLPFFDSNVRGIFFGLERFHTRKEIMRSIFEASGYMVHDIIASIEGLGIKVRNIHMSGGLTTSKIACKIRADITGKKVLVSNHVEGTSLGALFILLVEDGVCKNLKETARLVTFSDVYEPDIKMHRRYKKLFELYKTVYGVNKKLMEQRKEIINELKLVNEQILENL